MSYNWKMRILSVALSIALMVSLFNGFDISRSFADSNSQEVEKMERLLDRFSVTQNFVDSELAAGYSVNQIYAALMKVELDGIDYAAARLQLFPDEINLSTNAQSEVSNASLPLDLVLTDADSTVTGQVYDPQVMNENNNDDQDATESDLPETSVTADVTEESIEQEIQYDHSQGTEDLSTSEEDTNLLEEDQLEESSQNSEEPIEEDNEQTEDELSAEGETVLEEPLSMMAMSGPGGQEEAPVFNKSTISQAPYSINMDQESISSLSGDLSLYQTDMTLPGRGGLSFALTRQYNSLLSPLIGFESSTLNGVS
ncbi:hypothetical protein RB620_27870 [Paenibacillus sp. LHD-117]|uniref:hypothetical protein n=1 Tax=Paenibacillus sp. LHD-117 TaxID=3071412 RepID=UPI0027E20053|nr:hypothetical protein [Paenibacillus sp. LHD-117]MDQ6423252.1 hypothetical protein [Paenibacillus sp. LHD-117]